jgi:hypothetical protein
MNKETAQVELSQLKHGCSPMTLNCDPQLVVFWAADKHGNPNKGKGPLLVYLADSLDSNHFDDIPMSAYVLPLAAWTDYISGSAI